MNHSIINRTKLLFATVLLLTSCSPKIVIKTVPESNIKAVSNTGMQVISQLRIDKSKSKSSKALMWELIYLGKENNFIRLLYREYYSFAAGDYVKSDYTVEYKYDLSESKVIKFRDNEIEIINSTPSTLEYIIRSASLKYSTETPCDNQRLASLTEKRRREIFELNSHIKLTPEENAELDSLEDLCNKYKSIKKWLTRIINSE